MNKTKIEWTNYTWNPIHGCSKVSAGCQNCYAEAFSRKMKLTKLPWTSQNAKENITIKPHKLNEPFALTTPTMIFVNSMSDLYHPKVLDNFIEKIFNVMHALPQHVFQILTKRPDRAIHWEEHWWTPNIWLGTSIENKKTLRRIKWIQESNAQIKFLSFEPLLEDLGEINLKNIDWVIVGGESGNNYRPMNHAWARNIRDQCIDENIPFFFKQSSGYKPNTGTQLIEPDGKSTEWKQFPDTLPSKLRPTTHIHTTTQLSLFQ